jgi:hypothetical protein
MLESNVQLRRILASEAVDRLADASRPAPKPRRHRLRLRPGHQERPKAAARALGIYSQVSSRRGA